MITDSANLRSLRQPLRRPPWRRLTGLLFVLPALVFFALLLLYPILLTFYLAFTRWTGFDASQIEFVGWANFAEMLGDRVFWLSFWHTIGFVIGTTVLLNLLGLGFALLVDLRLPGSGFFKAVLFLPVLLSPVLVGVMWSRMLDAFGIVNQLLKLAGLTKTPILFLGDPQLSLATVVLATVWQYTAYDMLIYFAGLQAIPGVLLEAAAIDGAGPLTRVRRITIPLLTPVITVVLLLNFIGGFKVFDVVYVMTRGGPNHHSEVLATYLYEQAFRFNAMGYASALALVIVALSFAVSYLRMRTAGSVEELS